MFGKKSSSPNAATRPSVDPSLPPRTERAGADSPPPAWPDNRTPITPTSASGILAGQVIDSYNRPPPQTYIELTATGDATPAAPIEVAADSQGYFTIQGLQAGKRYQLIARA